MTRSPSLRALLVDPSLFTAPYDAALTEGLLAAGVEPTWAIRATRPGDREEIPTQYAEPFFYRKTDAITRVPPSVRAVAKGFAHALGLWDLLRRVIKNTPDVVHFQWTVLPPLDALAILLIRRWCSVVVTVHDTTPFNGERRSAWQSFAFDLPLKCADRLIVHTKGARAELLRRGLPASKLAVIPHGPLRLSVEAASGSTAEDADPRFTFVLCGELKRYKGLDLLVEALASLPEPLRARGRVIIAGRPRMDLTPITARIAELGLGGMVEIRAHRLSEQELADLLSCADCFLFPYRRVDASGVYFLIKARAKWIIASRVGVFAEDMEDGVDGELVAPEEPAALAAAIARAISERPRPEPRSSGAAWSAIGLATRDLYLVAVAQSGVEHARSRHSLPPSSGRPPALHSSPLGRRALTTGAAALAFVAAGLMVLWFSSSGSPERDSSRAIQSLEPEASALPHMPLGLAEDSDYRLVKNWDFRTLIRDPSALRAEFHTRYLYDSGRLDHLNDEWSRYRDADNHVFTPQGLELRARTRGELAPGRVESGMLRSRWTGRYGVFEIRMKVPAGRGLWPAFWLNPQDGTWPPEIDVVEIVDNGRDTTERSFHFLHGIGADARPSFSKLNRDHAYEPGVDYADDYHVFSVEWTEGRVRHLVDGAPVVNRAYGWLHDDGKDGGQAHVLVNLAVGGNWPGPPAASSLPASLQIQYIRVWQR